MIKVKPKEVLTRKDLEDFELWAHEAEGTFLRVTKPLIITSPMMIFFWVMRVIMLVVFWYAAIYVFTSRVFLVHLWSKPVFLPFLAIYMAVMFNAFYQTFDFFQRIINDINFYKTYKNSEKKYTEKKAQLEKENRIKK